MTILYFFITPIYRIRCEKRLSFYVVNFDNNCIFGTKSALQKSNMKDNNYIMPFVFLVFTLFYVKMKNENELIDKILVLSFCKTKLSRNRIRI